MSVRLQGLLQQTYNMQTDSHPDCPLICQCEAISLAHSLPNKFLFFFPLMHLSILYWQFYLLKQCNCIYSKMKILVQFSILLFYSTFVCVCVCIPVHGYCRKESGSSAKPWKVEPEWDNNPPAACIHKGSGVHTPLTFLLSCVHCRVFTINKLWKPTQVSSDGSRKAGKHMIPVT